jgi:uncharacterized membrane protein YkvA (DUF1232 family)
MDWLLIAALVALAVLGLLAAGGWLLWRRASTDARRLMKRIAKLPLRDKLRFGLAMLRDERVPLHVRAVLPGLLIYLALPLDIVPDFIPVLGQVDDIVVAIVCIGVLLRYSPRRVIEEHLQRLEAGAT